MSRKFNDIISLNFEVKSKGAERLNKIAKNLERMEKSLSKLNRLGYVLGENFEPIKKANQQIKESVSLLERLRKKIDDVKTGKGLNLFGEYDHLYLHIE
jgi:hypothetical protein